VCDGHKIEAFAILVNSLGNLSCGDIRIMMQRLLTSFAKPSCLLRIDSSQLVEKKPGQATLTCMFLSVNKRCIVSEKLTTAALLVL
jgi:hypothetical protein